MGRRRRTVAVLAVAAAALAAGLIAAEMTAAWAPPPPAGPAAQARAACADMRVVESRVSADAPARGVLGRLTAAQRLATSAARTDPAFQALADGIDALLLGVRTNQGFAAYEGIEVVLQNCRHGGG